MASTSLPGGSLSGGSLSGGASGRHPLASVLDPLLLEVLACPAGHHTPLTTGEPGNPLAMALSCPECGRIFDVRDGIPVLLLDEARYATAGAAVPSDTTDPSATTADGS